MTVSADADAVSLTTDLRAAREELDAVESRIEEVGEASVVTAADTYRTATDLLDRYVDTATGTGDFEAYVRFQERFLDLVEELDDDVLARDAFEEAAELLDKRRLSESDFQRARELLEPAREYVRLLERRETAEEDLRTVEHDAHRRLSELEDERGELERLLRLGNADLDAPTERLRNPIETYNDAVRADFEAFRSTVGAREALRFVATTEAFPLVNYRQPPTELAEYVESKPAGEEPIPTLLEYADYSPSKLDHYVDDVGALRTRVAVHRTYLEQLGADPLVVSWPPPEAGVLRYQTEELVSVVGRFAGEETVAALRAVRALPRTTDYDRLRTAAEAESALTDDERERLRTGDVTAALERTEGAIERLETALEE